MERVFDAGWGQLDFERRIALLASAQHGVFSRRQVSGLGGTKDVIRRRLGAGHWEQVAPHVFRVAGAPFSLLQASMGACLAWGTGAVASHRAAAALWRFAGFEAGPLELTVPRSRKRNGPGLVHRHALPVFDVTNVDGIPVTTPARTLIDLASVASRENVEEALDDALRRGLVSISRLRRRLDELGKGRTGVGMLRQLIEARDPTSPIPESVFERRVLRALRRARLPHPMLQYKVRARGRLIAVVDFAYPEQHLAIEADGYRWHAGRSRWKHDQRRGNQLTVLGWRVIHVTWEDLSDERATWIALVRKSLRARP